MLLLVEDDEISRLSFARILAARGYQVMTAADGEEALNLLEQHRLELIITDLAVPKVTGFGLLNHIRAKWPSMPAILVTAYLSPEAAKMLLNDKIKFLSKPLDPNKLVATINLLTLTPG